jgi:hypothetical protein
VEHLLTAPEDGDVLRAAEIDRSVRLQPLDVDHRDAVVETLRHVERPAVGRKGHATRIAPGRDPLDDVAGADAEVVGIAGQRRRRRVAQQSAQRRNVDHGHHGSA